MARGLPCCPYTRRPNLLTDAVVSDAVGSPRAALGKAVERQQNRNQDIPDFMRCELPCQKHKEDSASKSPKAGFRRIHYRY